MMRQDVNVEDCHWSAQNVVMVQLLRADRKENCKISPMTIENSQSAQQKTFQKTVPVGDANTSNLFQHLENKHKHSTEWEECKALERLSRANSEARKTLCGAFGQIKASVFKCLGHIGLKNCFIVFCKLYQIVFPHILNYLSL